MSRLIASCAIIAWWWPGLAPAYAQSAPVTGESERRMMRMTAPKDVIIGEQFALELNFPRFLPEHAVRPFFMHWYRRGEPLQAGPKEGEVAIGLHQTPVEISFPKITSAPRRISIIAPYQPGDYEVRLFMGTGSWWSALLLDRILIRVAEGRITNGILLTKTVFLTKGHRQSAAQPPLPGNRHGPERRHPSHQSERKTRHAGTDF
jgi:hypothetical protein